MKNIIYSIEDELQAQKNILNLKENIWKAKRIEERTQFDLEMIRELGYCSGIENYSRF